MLVVHHLLWIILLLNHNVLLTSLIQPPNTHALDLTPEQESFFLPQIKCKHHLLHLQVQSHLWMMDPQPSFPQHQDTLHQHHHWTKYLNLLNLLTPSHQQSLLFDLCNFLMLTCHSLFVWFVLISQSFMTRMAYHHKCQLLPHLLHKMYHLRQYVPLHLAHCHHSTPILLPLLLQPGISLKAHDMPSHILQLHIRVSYKHILRLSLQICTTLALIGHTLSLILMTCIPSLIQSSIPPWHAYQPDHNVKLLHFPAVVPNVYIDCDLFLSSFNCPWGSQSGRFFKTFSTFTSKVYNKRFAPILKETHAALSRLLHPYPTSLDITQWTHHGYMV